MKSMIFVGGVHGVGKTTFCNMIYEKYHLLSYSASRLISDAKKQEFGPSKGISDVDTNQDLLVDALEDIGSGDRWFLLDGHFCLIDKVGRIVRVPENTFQQLAPKAIIVLTNTIESIQDRLLRRDNFDYAEDFLEKFQAEELLYAEEVSKTLRVPYLECRDDHADLKAVEMFLIGFGAISK
jgi:adenylate kinase